MNSAGFVSDISLFRAFSFSSAYRLTACLASRTVLLCRVAASRDRSTDVVFVAIAMSPTEKDADTTPLLKNPHLLRHRQS
jgi:hypothetical protein